MAIPFEIDPFPGRPKILFIGCSLSTHTQSWIDLFEDAQMNVRLFPWADGIPPAEWKVKSYHTMSGKSVPRNSPHRRSLFPLTAPQQSLVGMGVLAAKLFKLKRPSWKSALAGVIRSWKPDIVHTLGMNPSSYDFHETCAQFQLNVKTWVVQVRGGPELHLNQHLPNHQARIDEIITRCDQWIADNQQNYDLLSRMGVPGHRLASLGVVPGSGGIEVQELSGRWPGLPSERSRIIVCPKIYEAPSSKALPILEALRLAWPQIRPCQIYLLWATQPEILAWFAKLPAEIQESCTLLDRIPRTETLDLFLKARVMLAPSLTDGIPNSMLEAMACGAFPIVSPIETLTPLLHSPGNTLFARNLYPEEISRALVQAMNDDELVDATARRNLEFVDRQSNRTTIRPRVIAYYERLAAARSTGTLAPDSTFRKPHGVELRDACNLDSTKEKPAA